MLTWACRRFRARFSPSLSSGPSHPHRRTCPECDAFAAALESAAGVRLPLPEGLRKSLRKIAGPGEGSVLAFPVPRLAVPPALAARLSAVSSPGRPAPPDWVLNPRYAVAASALLALLLGPFLARGADRGAEALGHVRAEVSPLLHRTSEDGREEIGKLRGRAVEAYSAARRSLAQSAESLEGFSSRLLTVVPDSFTHTDPRD